MRPLLLFLLACLPFLSAAQGIVAIHQPTAQVVAAPDTVAALHRLFAAKRKRNNRFVAGTLGVAALGGVVLSTSPSTWDGLDQAVLGIAIIALGSVPALTIEAFTAMDYNKKSERQAIESFQAYKMPRYLKRKLKAKYFNELASPS